MTAAEASTWGLRARRPDARLGAARGAVAEVLMRAATATVAGVLLLTACGPGDEAARRGRLEAQRAHLAASLERLEARLLDGQGRVRAWQELRARHGRVAAVACQVNERHVADMARLELEERAPAAGALRLVAAVAPPGHGRGGGVALQPALAGPPAAAAAGPAVEPPGTRAHPPDEAVPGSGGD